MRSAPLGTLPTRHRRRPEPNTKDMYAAKGKGKGQGEGGGGKGSRYAPWWVTALALTVYNTTHRQYQSQKTFVVETLRTLEDALREAEGRVRSLVDSTTAFREMRAEQLGRRRAMASRMLRRPWRRLAGPSRSEPRSCRCPPR